MLIGVFALVVYCAFCAWAASKPRLPVWLGAAMGWLLWGATAAGAFWLVHDVLGLV